SSPTTIGVGTMAMFAIFSQATASFFDYGLYIPANMLLFAVLMGFLACHAQSLGGRLKTGVWFQAKTPNYLVQVFVLGLFAVSTMVALDFHRRATLDSLMRPRSQFFDRENMDLTKTDTRIRDLTALVKQTPTTDSLNYLGALWLHRSQLAHYESFTTNLDSKILMDARTDEEKRKKLDNYWSMTEILRMQEKAFYLKKFGRRGESQAYIFGKPVADNLPWALGYYEISRRASPLQPLVHLRIGEIKSVLRAEHPREADVDVERAIELAPMNPNFRNIAGIYYLQSGNGLAAVPHFRRYLEMVPNKFNSLMNLVTGRTSRRLEILSDEAMGEIIPKDGKMLYLFVTQHLASDSPMREKLLKEAMAAVVGSEPRMRGHYALVGDILKEQGGLENLKKAVEEYSLALRGIPNDPPTRYKRAELLYGLGRFEEALEDAENLEFHAPKNSTYRTLLKKVNSAVTDKKAGLE
ncbi:MAG: tetratricopeptide (TPR) repeat protein, partial [Mariniblastus sp.]